MLHNAANTLEPVAPEQPRATTTASEEVHPKLSEERVVFQVDAGNIEFAFLPEVAPVTAAHIFRLVQLGLYTTNQVSMTRGKMSDAGVPHLMENSQKSSRSRVDAGIGQGVAGYVCHPHRTKQTPDCCRGHEDVPHMSLSHKPAETAAQAGPLSHEASPWLDKRRGLPRWPRMGQAQSTAGVELLAAALSSDVERASAIVQVDPKAVLFKDGDGRSPLLAAAGSDIRRPQLGTRDAAGGNQPFGPEAANRAATRQQARAHGVCGQASAQWRQPHAGGPFSAKQLPACSRPAQPQQLHSQDLVHMGEAARRKRQGRGAAACGDEKHAGVDSTACC
ncbi:PPIase cyclophilin-type domain-containing protein, partial [Haematococcus lacustris]